MGNNLLLLLNEQCYVSDDLFFKFLIRLNFNIFDIGLNKLNNIEEQFLFLLAGRIGNDGHYFDMSRLMPNWRHPQICNFIEQTIDTPNLIGIASNFTLQKQLSQHSATIDLPEQPPATNTTISIRGHGVVEMRAITVKVFPNLQIAAMCRQFKPV